MRFLASAKSLDEREVIGTQKTSNAQRSTPNIQIQNSTSQDIIKTWAGIEPAETQREFEAGAGIEPANSGFADPAISGI